MKGSCQSINNSDVVAGWAAFATGTHAYTWTQAGGISDLGTLGGSAGMAWGINNSGVVVGQSRTSANALDGFVYMNGTMYDLNSVVDSNPGYTSTWRGSGAHCVSTCVAAPPFRKTTRIGDILRAFIARHHEKS